MPSRRTAFWFIPALVLGASAFSSPSPSHAQAWVPGPGKGSVTLGYQYTKITDHLFSHVDGKPDRADLGQIFGKTAGLSAGYGILPGLAANASIAYVSGKYSGVLPPHGALDDGRYHGDLQDILFGVRYMIQWEGFAITPNVGFRVPSKSYITFGHVAVGRGLNEIATGIALGRSFSPLLPGAYASVSYERAFVENHDVHSLDRNLLGMAAGYFINRSLSLGGSLHYVNTVDGIGWREITTQAQFHIHDVATKEKALRAGGFVNLNLWRELGLTVSYLHTLSGENSMASRSFTVSPSWSFSTPLHW